MYHALRPALALVLFLVASGCSSDDTSATDASRDSAVEASSGVDAGVDAAPLKRVFGGARPVALKVPKAYDASQSWPLLLVLHGYSATGFLQETLLGLTKLVEGHGVLLASPDGTIDAAGKQFWNATDACCDFGGTGVDDVAYLTGLIDEIGGVYNVDPRRIYLIGHSNGGFMSYRMACDRADRIAAIISLAGATNIDAAKCAPSEPVSVLEIHGDADDVVEYAGGTSLSSGGGPYPGAVTSTELWAGYDGCAKTRTEIAPLLDLDTRVAGPETKVERYDGCPTGLGVELLDDGRQRPRAFPTADFAERCWAFFEAHPKPVKAP